MKRKDRRTEPTKEQRRLRNRKKRERRNERARGYWMKLPPVSGKP